MCLTEEEEIKVGHREVLSLDLRIYNYDIFGISIYAAIISIFHIVLLLKNSI